LTNHYKFYKKEDKTYINEIVVDDDYELNKLDLKEGDFYEITSIEDFKSKLTHNRKTDCDRHGFTTGKYQVFKINPPSETKNYKIIFLKEII